MLQTIAVDAVRSSFLARHQWARIRSSLTWTGRCYTLFSSPFRLLSTPRPISTLIDSTPGVLKAWATFAKDYNLDADTVAHATHGRRLYDTLKEYCNIMTNSNCMWRDELPSSP